MHAGGRIEDAAAMLDESAVAALFWRVVNLGKWATAKGFATQLDFRNELRLLMGRCLELDPGYFYGGPHRALGAYYARAPSMVGGDLERSQSHFQQSLNLGPNYLATRVLYAQDYAVKAENRELFVEQLRLVVEADPAVDPSIEPENRVERRKAERLLAQADLLFD
jgi:hypothetical protein